MANKKESNGLYQGEIKSGTRHGQGIVKYDNGDLYVGQWKYGKKHGQGTMIYATDDIEEGLWEKDIFLGEKFSMAKTEKETKETNYFLTRTIQLTTGQWKKAITAASMVSDSKGKKISFSEIIRMALDDYLDKIL